MRSLASTGGLVLALTCTLLQHEGASGYRLPTVLSGTPSMTAQQQQKQQPQQPRHQRQMVSAGSRRDALLKGGFGAAVLGLAVGGVVASPAQPAQAFPFGGGDSIEGSLDEIARARAKVEEVVVQLKEKKLKGGREDSATVVRYADAVFKPMQEKLAALAPKIKLDGAEEEKQKRLETLPFLLKGHLLELAAACRSGDAAEQLEEMEEVAESVDEFLGLAAAKYTVKSYVGPAPDFDVVKEYGPFACEFWGKVRLEESNVCVYPEELKK